MKAWLQFFRVGLVPTAWSNVLLGAFLNHALDDLDGMRLALILGTTTLLYLFGMGLNDFRDRGRDATIHPDRPIPSGAISPTSAAIALFVVLGGAFGLAAVLGLNALAWCGTIVLFILLYDLLFKDNSVLGPVSMGSVRATLVIFGGASIHPEMPWVDGGASAIHMELPVFLASTIVGLYVCLLTYYSMEEEKARPDVLARRGRAVFFVTLAALCTLQVWMEPHTWWMSFLGICIWCFWTTGLAMKPLRETPIRAGLVTYRLLLGLTVLDLAILLAYHLLWPAALSAALWLFISYKTLKPKRVQ